MKHVIMAAVLICGFASACTVRSERTIVEKPVAAPAAVVVADPPPTTVVYRSN